jgi:hypothetical protein
MRSLQGHGVDAYLKGQMQKRHIPGLQLAVVRTARSSSSALMGWPTFRTVFPWTIELW